VQINEGTKILTGSLAKEVEENDLFSTLFDSLTPGNYLHYNVRVEVRNKDTGPWITVHEGLESKLLLMKMLEFTKLKYVILPSDIAVSSPSHIRFPNAFTRLMEFKLQLPQNGAYNEYYQQMKKKKPQLTRLELFQLANSIEISLTEPWVSEAFWQEVISNIFEFTSMLKKYTENLKTTNDNMKRIHKSGNPVREPSSNCNIHLISKNDEEIDERYFELDSDLKNNELFDFVDLDQYAPNDPIKKHNFIRDIQLSVPAGLYSGKTFYKRLEKKKFSDSELNNIINETLAERSEFEDDDDETAPEGDQDVQRTTDRHIIPSHKVMA
ncbi:22272_t:CDS:2, partial [Rhizophagus irregularis]